MQRRSNIDENLGAEQSHREFRGMFGKMELFVRTERAYRALDVKADDVIYFIKYLLEQVEGTARDQQRLTFAGMQLEDDRALADYNINEGAVIHMEVTGEVA